MQFSALSEAFDRLEKVSGRLEMTDILAELLRNIPSKEVKEAVYILQGQLAPSYQQIDIGMGEKFVMEAISKVSGYSRAEVEKKFKSLGDLGNVAEELLQKKKQKALFSEPLTLHKVYSNLYKIATASGSGSQESKINLLGELLNSSSPTDARFIARFPIGNLRLGVGDPTIMDALADEFVEECLKEKKFRTEVEESVSTKKEKEREEEIRRKARSKIRERIEEKYNIHPDLGKIAELLKQKRLKGLEELDIEPGIPIRPTLAERLNSAEEIIEKLGKCAVEAKYDGFRLAVHKKGNQVWIFSRHSENVTDMFPDIAEAVRKQINSKSAIFEGEALAYNEGTKQFYPFQITMQRKRKYDVKEKTLEFPLKMFCFDVLYVDGKSTMEKSFLERRKKLQEVIGKGETISLTDSIITDDAKELEEFFQRSVEDGLEGIIAKDLQAPYIAGARKFAWIKLKRSYKGELQDSVDVAIVGFYKGKGKRTEFGLGGLLTAVYDEKEDSFKTLCKIGTGLSEKQLEDFEKMLNKISRKQKPARVDSKLTPDVWCEPQVVVEVRADEITQSPIHTCGWKDGAGLALRFPRLISLRTDKKAEECTSAQEIEQMFKAQKSVQLSEGEK